MKKEKEFASEKLQELYVENDKIRKDYETIK